MAIVFKGRVFSVEVGKRRFPNGQEHEVEIVRHAESVVLIPIEDDGRVVIVKQYRAPLDRETWEFPAGRVNEGEPAEEGARRECEEEIGRVPHRLERLCGLYPTPGFCDEKLIFFRASDLRPPPPDSPHRPDADEDISTRTVGVDEVRAMLERGEIVDLKTAYALTLI
ncbi:MAG TPA: NUDIX hydrolase [Vicinamibacterales bacterium]|jgi:ADP-ribose pyrophosphatase|nr:NUDIX hydrolase [Vicinamibacterales bacterium]